MPRRSAKYLDDHPCDSIETSSIVQEILEKLREPHTIKYIGCSGCSFPSQTHLVGMARIEGPLGKLISTKSTDCY